MQILRHTDQSKSLTTFTIIGEVTFPDIVNVIEALEDNPPELNVIWDFSNSEPNDSFNAINMDEIASLVKTKLGLRHGGKTAYIATSDVVFGIIRMYKTYLEFKEIAHEVEVFRTIDKAHQWLSKEVD